MSWSDAKALEQIKKFRDQFNVRLFIETGTFKGVNAAVHANNFDKVLTIEKVEEYYAQAVSKLTPFYNVQVVNADSAEYLGLDTTRQLIASHQFVIIYLDAHFYDPTLLPEQRWVILRELVALVNTPNVILVIHDFDNGLGHLTYGGQSMDFKFLGEALFAINSNFRYYTNTQETCDILTKDRVAMGEVTNLVLDEVTADNLDYAWSSENKTYRGILYCSPIKLDLSKFDIIQIC